MRVAFLSIKVAFRHIDTDLRAIFAKMHRLNWSKIICRKWRIYMPRCLFGRVGTRHAGVLRRNLGSWVSFLPDHTPRRFQRGGGEVRAANLVSTSKIRV
ncbi:hypothetical protein RR11_916 [Ruegeria sp. R11]|nr:hypothetical protein RR11_916 [Ruegeria sp. R11]